MSWWQGLLGFTAGLLIAVVTTPVGVSGAVFLLPVQLSVLQVPNPAVTPTNLLFNVVATPGALLRYRKRGHLGGPLTRLLVFGTLPGVVVGALVRVFLLPGAQVFRLLVACLLFPLGLWLCVRTVRPPRRHGAPDDPSPGAVTALAVAVGVVGGMYGIGGGSLLGPILVGRGLPVATVAPAALASTFLTSIAGALTYAVLALTTPGTIAPDWALGLLCGLGGLAGGYLGAHLQPRLPETGLRLLLGALAIALAGLYAVQALA
ncbi:TSUP family transporter [Streptosporangium sp. CA-135522]|uniref:TSUP family transporter n=1 Tax=Streptosporangium sp. CA-135522 TaxID=3240072 RepID=UPI003D90C6EF